MKSFLFIFAVFGFCISTVLPVPFFVGGEYPPYEERSAPKLDDTEDSITSKNSSSLSALNTTVNGTKTAVLTGGTFSDTGDHNMTKLSNTSLSATNKTVNETAKISNQTIKINNNETSNLTNKTTIANVTVTTTTTTSKPTENNVTNSSAAPHNTTETKNNSTNLTPNNSTNVTSEAKSELTNVTKTAVSSNATAALKMEPNTTDSSKNSTAVSGSEGKGLNATAKTATSANATEVTAKSLNDTKKANETLTKTGPGNTTESTTTVPAVHNDTSSKNVTKRNAEFESRINNNDDKRKIKLDNETVTEPHNVNKNGTGYINGTVCDVINGTEICDYFNSTSENINGNEVVKILFGSKKILDLADGTETYEYVIIEEEYDERSSVEETTPSAESEESYEVPSSIVRTLQYHN